jgi:hypothetical protein
MRNGRRGEAMATVANEGLCWQLGNADIARKASKVKQCELCHVIVVNFLVIRPSHRIRAKTA